MATRTGKRIVANPDVRFGLPVIEGTRVDVGTILRALGSGWSIDEVMREYDITVEGVQAALLYAADILMDYRPHQRTSAK